MKESATEAREIREGFIDLAADPYLVAEPCDSKPLSEYPFAGSDFLSLELVQGTSMRRAQDIAASLNANVCFLLITRFGDREDAIRDVRQSAHVRSIDAERFNGWSECWRRSRANDVGGIREALVAVQSVSADLLAGWAKALQLSGHNILKTFREDEDPHAKLSIRDSPREVRLIPDETFREKGRVLHRGRVAKEEGYKVG